MDWSQRNKFTRDFIRVRGLLGVEANSFTRDFIAACWLLSLECRDWLEFMKALISKVNSFTRDLIGMHGSVRLNNTAGVLMGALGLRRSRTLVVLWLVCRECELQASVYDMLPPATVIIGYAIGLRKVSANRQFFVGAQKTVSLQPLELYQAASLL